MPKPQLGTHRCRMATLTGLDRNMAALTIHVEPYPLSPAGEVAALRENRATYQIAPWGLALRKPHHIRTHPAGTRTVLAEHRCGAPIPQDWKAPPKPRPRPAHNQEVPF